MNKIQVLNLKKGFLLAYNDIHSMVEMAQHKWTYNDLPFRFLRTIITLVNKGANRVGFCGRLCLLNIENHEYRIISES